MIKHLAPISSIASSASYVATAGYDNQVILWSKADKTFINRGQHDHLANYVTFSPNGAFLLSTSSDYTARLWSVPAMKLVTVFNFHEDDVENASFSNCGNYVATACRDHQVRIFAKTGALLKVCSGHSADVLSVSWTQDDAQIISSGDDGTIRIWDVATAQETAQFSFDEVETDTCAVLEKQIFAGNDAGEIVIIDRHHGQVVAQIKAHESGIKSLKINPLSNWLISASYDKTVKIWQVVGGSTHLSLVETVHCPSDIWLRAFQLMDKNTLIFGTFGSCYASYQLDSKMWDFKGVEITTGLNAVTVSDDSIYAVGDSGFVFKNAQLLSKMGSLCNFLLKVNHHILTGGQTGQIFDAVTGEVLYTHHAPINCGTTYQLNETIYAILGTYTGEGIVFAQENDRMIFKQIIPLHTNAIKGIASNGTVIFSVCANRDIAIHSCKDLERLKHYKHAHFQIANGADWVSADTFVSISRDKKLRIWDAATDEVAVIDTPHTHSIKCVKVSSVSRHLISTGSYNGFFCIYDLRLKTWIYAKRLTTSGISCIGFSESENCFLASSYDGTIYKISL